MSATIHAIGNEGFEIVTAGVRVFVDAFFAPTPRPSPPRAHDAASAPAATIILVTHAHWDHFNPVEVAKIAAQTGATVVGPASVTQTIRHRLPPAALVELEPAETRRGGSPDSRAAQLPAARVTAFRTRHSPDHNSYLVELDGFRFFHDGDNERTQPLDPAAIRPLDALFIGPWQGAGWVEFVERLEPKRWFLMHLDEAELAQHERGEFLPDLCDHVPLPDRLVVLRPGQSFEFA